jgi:hypothetical protein
MLGAERPFFGSAGQITGGWSQLCANAQEFSAFLNMKKAITTR